MTTDDLSTPLGQKPARRRGVRLPVTATQVLAGLLGAVLLAFVGYVIFGDNPLGGEPVAKVAMQPGKTDSGSIAPSPATADVAAPARTTPGKDAAVAPTAGPGQKTITIIDGSSGVRRDVIVSANGEAADGAPAAASSTAITGADPRLLEKSRYGMIPIAAAGLKPFTAYAEGTDATRAAAATKPVIAIVISGLGIGAAKTTDAIMKLPAAVTLAFTPYGADPAKFVERARSQRHEVLLQVPMEPFDYPDNDPGPQTLLTTLDAEQNIDRLTWHLSRIQGYVGLASFMGAKFVATDAAMQPLMREAAKRGLGYLDDGATPRSLAGPIAEAQAMPFARTDLTIDAVPTPAEIDRALAKLEGAARDRGSAIGTASALPVSIDRIAVWAKQLESRGILLVPLTTAMLKSKSG